MGPLARAAKFVVDPPLTSGAVPNVDRNEGEQKLCAWVEGDSQLFQRVAG